MQTKDNGNMLTFSASFPVCMYVGKAVDVLTPTYKRPVQWVTVYIHFYIMKL